VGACQGHAARQEQAEDLCVRAAQQWLAYEVRVVAGNGGRQGTC
jgi:hypothetical protein